VRHLVVGHLLLGDEVNVPCFICNQPMSLEGTAMERHLRAHTDAESAAAYKRVGRLGLKRMREVPEGTEGATKVIDGDEVKWAVEAPPPEPEVKSCFFCRAGNHQQCVFSAAHCACKAANHEPKGA
jgi:hypothetical protein